MAYSGPELYVDLTDGTFSLDEGTGNGNTDDVQIGEFPDISSSEKKIYYRVDELLSWLVPSQSAISKRDFVLDYIKNILSRCLGARMFPVGSMMGKIFLPDEYLQITPFLCKGQDESWFIRVNEALCNSSLGPNKVQGINVEKVSFLPADVKIILQINSVTVDISPNELSTLYTSALTEDFHSLISSDNLFKRSLLLVKAWITYEAPRYITDFSSDPVYFKTVPEPLLPPIALTVLMIRLFYSHGGSKMIQHPMRALELFLATYSVTQWDHVGIGACSVIHLDDWSLGQDSVPPTQFAQQTELLIESYRLRYLNTVRASQRVREEVDESGGVDDGDGKDWIDGDGGGSGSGRYYPPNNNSSNTGFQNGYNSPNLSSSPPTWSPLSNDHYPPVESASPAPLNSSSSYQRGAVNILDPVQPLTNLCSKIDRRGAAMLDTALRRGHEAFRTLKRSLTDLAHSGGSEGDSEELSLLRQFFSNTFVILTNPNRFDDEVGPPQGQTPAQVSLTLSSLPPDELEYFMRHAELVLASKITADAVAHLIVHVIEQRGPQPIGEIGKLLQEATGNPNLSKVLKSQFRGLKRLIEGYPQLLRLGDDHSFNPHVHLVTGRQHNPGSHSNQQQHLQTSQLQGGHGQQQLQDGWGDRGLLVHGKPDDDRLRRSSSMPHSFATSQQPGGSQQGHAPAPVRRGSSPTNAAIGARRGLSPSGFGGQDDVLPPFSQFQQVGYGSSPTGSGSGGLPSRQGRGGPGIQQPSPPLPPSHHRVNSPQSASEYFGNRHPGSGNIDTSRGQQSIHGQKTQLWGSGDQYHIANAAIGARTNSFGSRSDLGPTTGPRQDSNRDLDRRFSFGNSSNNNYKSSPYSSNSSYSLGSSPAYSPVHSPNTSRNQSPMNTRGGGSAERPGSGSSVGSNSQIFHPINNINSSNNNLSRHRSSSNSSLLGNSAISSQSLSRSSHGFDHSSVGNTGGYDVRVPSIIPLQQRVSSPELPSAYSPYQQYGMDFGIPKDYGDVNNIGVGRVGSFNEEEARFQSGTASEPEFSMFNSSNT